MKKRILFINGHLKAGGIEKSLVDILRQIDFNQYNVDLMLTEDFGDYLIDVPNEVNIIMVNFKDTYGQWYSCLKNCFIKKNGFCFISRLIICLKKVIGLKAFYLFRIILPIKDKYDVVIAFRYGFCSEIGSYGVKSTKKITWWHHGEVIFSERQAKQFRKIAKHFDHVIAVSDPIKGKLISYFPELRKKIKTISNMVDRNMILIKSNEFKPYVDEKNRIFVSVSRLSPEKHVENVVYATLKLINKGYIDFHWYVIGDGSDYKKIKTLIKKYGLSSYIIMIGNKSNPYPYIRHANIFIHTSYIESQGLSVLEAMCLGCPCVVTKSLGVCSFLKHLDNAILVDQDVESLVDGIISIYDNEQIKEELVKNAYLTCSEFKPEVIMNKIYRIFDESK